MEWQDEAILLAVRPHGENDAIAHGFTFAHGRHAGLVKGGRSRRQRPVLQPGNRVELVWRARLAEHLGHFTVEPVRLFGNLLLQEVAPLTALAAATSLVDLLLPERDPHPTLYAALLRLLEALTGEGGWPATYVRFELVLLHELGFGLDLGQCAVTGATTDLAFVSPRTGRAVARDAAGALAPRLLPLPPFLAGDAEPDAASVAAGLRLTGHFLRRHLLDPADLPEPVARERLLSLLMPESP